jgi:G3E family GTPase
VALNKSDLVDEEKLAKLTELVPVKDCERVVEIYQTSAKTGAYVDQMFQQLAEKSLESK